MLIKLTRSTTKKAVWVRDSEIAFVESNGEHTLIILNNRYEISVMEAPETIMVAANDKPDAPADVRKAK